MAERTCQVSQLMHTGALHYADALAVHLSLDTKKPKLFQAWVFSIIKVLIEARLLF